MRFLCRLNRHHYETHRFVHVNRNKETPVLDLRRQTGVPLDHGKTTSSLAEPATNLKSLLRTIPLASSGHKTLDTS